MYVENLTATPQKHSIWSVYPMTLFAALAAFLFYVYLFAPAAVTLDGYSHLYGAKLLSWMLQGYPEVHSYFSYNSPLIPNWLCALLLAALSSIFSNELALRILIIMSGAALLFSLYYCIDATSYRPQQRAQVLIVLLPFASNAYLTFGFYGFLISSSMCLFVLGLMLRHGLRRSLRLQLVAACLLLVAYFSHPLPVILSFMFPFSQFVAEVVFQGRDGLRRSALTRFIFSLWPWALPACLILWFYLRLAEAGQPHAYSITENVRGRAIALARDAVLYISPTPSCGTLLVALLSILLAGILLRSRTPFVQNRLRIATLTVLIVSSMFFYLLVPSAVGDGLEIESRLLLFSAFFLVLLALIGGALSPQFLTVCSLIAALSVIGFGAEYLHVSRELAPAVAELRLAMVRVPEHSRIFILGYRLTPSCERWPLLDMTVPERHWALSSILERQLIVLNDYQARTSHFPLKHVRLQPKGSIDEADVISEQKKAAWFEVLNNDPDADFVVSWGAPSGPSNCTTAPPVVPPFEEVLRINYDLVFVNQETSRVQLWRKRG